MKYGVYSRHNSDFSFYKIQQQFSFGVLNFKMVCSCREIGDGLKYIL